MSHIHYPDNLHYYKGWTYKPLIEQDGDRFDRVQHCATHPDLPARYGGDIFLHGPDHSAFELLNSRQFAAAIDRVEVRGLPPPPGVFRPRGPLFSQIVKELKNG